MRCYNCKEQVSKKQHTRVQDKFDDIIAKENGDEEVEYIDNYLGMYHCTGDADLFDDDGFAVVCQDCLDKAENSFDNREVL